MNIYFSCSITGGRSDQDVYAWIVRYLQEKGHEVPTAHLSRVEVMAEEGVVEPVDVYHRDVGWVRGCDAVVAEVSTPSHGVGYEIALALTMNKPVICCYRKGRTVSKMILGNSHSHITVAEYEGMDELMNVLENFLAHLN